MLDDAIVHLRALTRGAKGNRPDYVGTISTADATVLIDFIDRVRPIYDGHAWNEDEIRYLVIYRQLTPNEHAQVHTFAQHLLTRPAAGATAGGATPQ